MKTTDNEASQKTTAEERRARKQHEERVNLVIETYERLIHIFARGGQREKCQEMADEMMERAKENPEDFGRWKSVAVKVASPPETPEPPEP